MAADCCPLHYESKPYRHAPACPTARAYQAERAARRAAGLCPTCGQVRLTRRQAAAGHQCNACADREEGAF